MNDMNQPIFFYFKKIQLINDLKIKIIKKDFLRNQTLSILIEERELKEKQKWLLVSYPQTFGFNMKRNP